LYGHPAARRRTAGADCNHGGQAAEAILDYAQAHAVDLIALETHGRTGLVRWLVGGVADKVIRSAIAPVLLHRPQDGGAH